MKKIAEDMVKLPLENKEKSDKWAGVYVFGDNKPFVLKECYHAFHAFRALSKYNYRIYLFININHTEELDQLLQKIDNIKAVTIPPLKDSFSYNYWFVNNLWFLIPPEHIYAHTFQNDGHVVKRGFEEAFENSGYSMAGARWNKPNRIIDEFNLPEIWGCNGGSSMRIIQHMRDIVLEANKRGGQEKLVKGMYVGENHGYNHCYIPEDCFFSHYIRLTNYKMPYKEECDTFSLEPMPFMVYEQYEKRPFVYHRIDSY